MSPTSLECLITARYALIAASRRDTFFYPDSIRALSYGARIFQVPLGATQALGYAGEQLFKVPSSKERVTASERDLQVIIYINDTLGYEAVMKMFNKAIESLID